MQVFSVNILSVLLLIVSYQFLEAFDLPPGCLDAFRRASLQVHNVLRGKHNSPSLNRDSSLDASALSYANFLAVNDVFYHSTNLVNTGENLYVSYSTDPLTVTSCTRNMFLYCIIIYLSLNNKILKLWFLTEVGQNCAISWYSEISMYNFNAPGFSKETGHFTQLVWAATSTVGFGLAWGLDTDTDGSVWNAFYCVAHYKSPGICLFFNLSTVLASFSKFLPSPSHHIPSPLLWSSVKINYDRERNIIALVLKTWKYSSVHEIKILTNFRRIILDGLLPPSTLQIFQQNHP